MCGVADVVWDASLESVAPQSSDCALTSTSKVCKNDLCAFTFSSTAAAAAGKGHRLTSREMGHELISSHLNVRRRLFSFVLVEKEGKNWVQSEQNQMKKNGGSWVEKSHSGWSKEARDLWRFQQTSKKKATLYYIQLVALILLLHITLQFIANQLHRVVRRLGNYLRPEESTSQTSAQSDVTANQMSCLL